MFDHPTPAELEAFVWDRGPAGGDRRIVVHLAFCDACLAIVTPHVRAIFGRGEPPPRVLSPEEEAEYEDAMDRVFTNVIQQARQLQEERKREAVDLFTDVDPDDLPEILPTSGGPPRSRPCSM